MSAWALQEIREHTNTESRGLYTAPSPAIIHTWLGFSLIYVCEVRKNNPACLCVKTCGFSPPSLGLHIHQITTRIIAYASRTADPDEEGISHLLHVSITTLSPDGRCEVRFVVQCTRKKIVHESQRLTPSGPRILLAQPP